jgi:TonB family protein
MNDLLTSLAQESTRWLEFWAAMNLQVAVFGLLALAADTLVRDVSPRYRYGLWLIVLAKACVPPVLSLPAAASSGTAAAFTLPAITAPLLGETARYAPLVFLLPAVLIFLASTAMLVVLGLRHARLSRVLRRALPADLRLDPAHRWPDILVSGEIDTPLAAGILRPRIYVTPALLAGPRATLDAVLYHELAHIRRGDRFVVLLQTLVQAAFALNPVVWIMNMRLHRYREQVCDGWALQRSGSRPQDYGKLLLSYAERSREPRVQMQSGTCFFETRRGFVQRVTMLFSQGAIMKLRFKHYAVMTAMLLVIVPLSWKCSDSSSPKEADVQPPIKSEWKSTDYKDHKNEQSPGIVGGFDAIRENLVYPEKAHEEGIEGMVLIKVKVNADGSASSIEFAKKANPLLDEAAMNAVKALKFTPATSNGKPVESEMNIPIKFKLQ